MKTNHIVLILVVVIILIIVFNNKLMASYTLIKPNNSTETLISTDSTYIFDNPPYKEYRWNTIEKKCFAEGSVWVNIEECKARGLI